MFPRGNGSLRCPSAQSRRAGSRVELCVTASVKVERSNARQKKRTRFCSFTKRGAYPYNGNIFYTTTPANAGRFFFFFCFLKLGRYCSWFLQGLVFRARASSAWFCAVECRPRSSKSFGVFGVELRLLFSTYLLRMHVCISTTPTYSLSKVSTSWPCDALAWSCDSALQEP
jgi:hypothetical protein